MMQDDNFSRTNKNNGSISKSKRKDKKLNKINTKKTFTPNKHKNLTE